MRHPFARLFAGCALFLALCGFARAVPVPEEIYAWYMDGTGAVASSEYLFTGALGDWRVAGITDLNSDGHADIVFQNTVGQIYAWFMNGSGAISSGDYLFTGGIADWRVRLKGRRLMGRLARALRASVPARRSVCAA